MTQAALLVVEVVPKSYARHTQRMTSRVAALQMHSLRTSVFRKDCAADRDFLLP